MPSDTVRQPLFLGSMDTTSFSAPWKEMCGATHTSGGQASLDVLGNSLLGRSTPGHRSSTHTRDAVIRSASIRARLSRRPSLGAVLVDGRLPLGARSY